ncbi:DUF637 domain-containing protein [uncultured Acinetobacter sp.]|uniref:two-partner secretion domain-containing protein n=1 Tax=uncultured Acinetobacter sp. TaxID=165433 RepID=UPI00259034A7|nr:DUF637 domain-containing protein [uncultured Acinetobacter sp.]
MNKNRYRVVYNKARQMFMAVAENVKSQTKASGQSTASSVTVEQSQPFHQLWQVKCLVASMSLWMPLAPVYAQIQADNSANAGNRPVIGVGQNSQGQNVPVVNIQTPTNGVSHNIYKQMDVLPEGVVLNNSRTGANSALVGTVGANPFLAQGEARIILNEVNSNVASRFEGNLEVAGQRADVIIANPAGINIQGGGFINANKAILTTGKPQLNADGSIQQFIVDQGKITVSAKSGSSLGLGGNNNNADYVDVYARALELNAQLYANKDIQAITGANNISADLQQVSSRTGAGNTPTLAIDVKNLGGMYANNIYLLGNEKGLGVSNAGTIRAVNNLVVTSAGKIEHTGSLESTSSTQGLVSLQTTQAGDNGNINSSGQISSYDNISINAANDINLTGKQIIAYNSPKLIPEMYISAAGDINIQNAKINNYGSNIYLDAGRNFKTTGSSEIGTNNQIYLSANGLIDLYSARVLSVYGVNLFANDSIKLYFSTLNAIGANASLSLKTTSESGGNNYGLNIDTSWMNYTGGLNLNSGKNINLIDLSLNKSGTNDPKSINIYTGGSFSWDGKSKAQKKINGDLNIQAKDQIELKNLNTITTAGDLKLNGRNLNIGNDLVSEKNVSLTATQGDLSLNKNITAQTNIDIVSLDGKLNLTAVKATSSQGKLSILGAKDTILTNFGTIQTTLNGYQGVNVGTIGQGNLALQNTVLESQNGNIVVTSEGQNTLTDSAITAKGNIELFAKDNLTLDGIKSSSQQHTALNSKKNIYINSQAATGDSVNFNSTKTTELNSTGTLSLISHKNQNLQNTKLTGGAVLLEAGGALNTPKTIEFNATGSDLLKNDSKLNSLNGDLSIQTKESLTIDPNIHTLKAIGDIELASKQGALTLMGYGGQAGNGSEKVLNLTTTGGGISLEGASVEVQGSQLNAQKDIKIVSTQGNVKVDGIKNILINNSSKKHINNLLDEIKLIEKNIDKLKNNSSLKDEELMYLNVYNQKNIILKIISDSIMGSNDGWSPIQNNSFFDDIYSLSYISFYSTQTEGDGRIYESVKIGESSYAFSKQQIEDKMDKYLNYLGLYENLKLKNVPIRSKISYLQGEIDKVNSVINYLSATNGSEHAEASLISDAGNISITSKRGTSISGATVSAKSGNVDIEAQGKLDQQYTSTATKGVNGQLTQVEASIIIDGHTDFYDKGNENDANYSMRTFISPTIINGDKSVTIRATGNTNQDNLVLQVTGITAANGDVRIEANKNILFDAAIEQSYDRSTTTEKKKSWGGLKKKYITTVAENNQANAASVDISGKNIFIESKEKNTANNIDIYSGKLTANGGQVSILSGGNINLYTVQESSSSNVDITKKSSFAGIKYNKSNTTSTRSQISELPGVLKADYIGIKADNDVRLVGTEFEYLQGAKIEAGRELSLLTASTTVTETLKKDKNSVVWQSMQDRGSVTETAQLPRFNGPTPPDFKAAGGLVVQIPIGEKDQNKIEIRDQILALANQPGNDYLKQLVNRNDVDWQKVILAQKDWDYKSQGLTAAGAAIIAIVVAALTYGGGVAAIGSTVQAASGATTVTVGGTTVTVGAGGSATFFGGTLLSTSTAAGVTTYTTTGIMINAAVTSIATQASVGLVNNQGDISKTVKDLGSKDSVKNLAASIVTAGLLSEVGLVLKIDTSGFPTRLLNNFTTAVGSTLVQTAIKGGDLEDNLKIALLAGLAGAVQGELALNIKGLEDVSYIAHKLAHALAGCIAGTIQKQCEAGAIGASIGEVVASFYDREPIGANVVELQKLENKIEITSKLVSGIVAAYAGYDVNTAANSASIAVQNNSNSEIRLEIENQEAFLQGLSPQERTEWETEFKKADLKLGELALFLSNFIPAGRNANETRSFALPLFKAWFQNRKIIQTFSKGGISYRVNLPEHIAKFERLKGTTVSGAHNKLEFETLQQTKNIKVVSTKPTQTKGIYEIEYQVPAYHPQQPGVITGYKRVETKTVYDPKVFTDSQIVDMSQKASALGYKEAVNLYKSSGGRMNQYESTYNGIKFRSYIAKNDNGQLFISNVHIVK